MDQSPTSGIQRSGGDVCQEIEIHVLNATNELLRRACMTAEPLIVDRKSDAPYMCHGTSQDCEFGLMLLTARDWLTRRGKLRGKLADSHRVKDLIVTLVKRIVESSTSNSAAFRGGSLEGSPIFFSGEPYTSHMSNRRIYYSSAHLHSAMGVLSFLSVALEKYDRDLDSVALSERSTLKEYRVETLRDAALFVCHEALRYAISCRVYVQDRFVGYSCDPSSAMETNSLPGSLEDYDRLFYSWTACEAIYRLTGWRSYLSSIENRDSSRQVISETMTLLGEVEGDLGRVSEWCRNTFIGRFKRMWTPPIAMIVAEIASLGDEISSDLVEDIPRLVKYVAQVYHLSQYASIRSLDPEGVMVSEAWEIGERLTTIVIQDILTTGMDAMEHRLLPSMLTRYYSLGASNSYAFADDAYFPLAVYSLSRLLSCAVNTGGEGAAHGELLRLTKAFRPDLFQLYSCLVGRRPKLEEEGDEHLWSFAADGPYVLYATQGTVLALIEYAKTLQTLDGLSGSPAGLDETLVIAEMVEPSRHHSCFISYSHQDRSFAQRLSLALRERGVPCWLDEEQMLPGDDIYEQIEHEIIWRDKVLLCCSRASLEESAWVDREIEKALEKEVALWKERGKKTLALIPLNLDNHLFQWKSGKASSLRARKAADFTGWEHDALKFEREVERLAKALRVDRSSRQTPE